MTNGYMCYDKLWKLLDKKGLNKQRMREAGFHPRTLSKLSKGLVVQTDVLCEICEYLNCQPKDIMEYKKCEPTEE